LTRGGGEGFGQGGFGQGPFGEGTGTPNVVVAVSESPHGLIQGQKFSIYNAPDPSFDGAFVVGTVLSTTSWSYNQVGPNATTNGGAAILWLRLYLTSQEELSIQNPFWRNQNITQIRSVYEDRTGNYQFGVDGKPATNLPIEILVSIRDTDTLAMTDGFLLPDPLIGGVKWKAMEYAALKDGEQRNPLVAKFAGMQFERWVRATERWMGQLGMEEKVMNMAKAGARG
jgi:hypothetical protein